MTTSANHFLSDRIKGIGSSGIRRIFDLGAQLKDPIDLSLGQPDFEVPANIKHAITQAVESNKNGYTPTRGLPELRKRIAEQLKAEFDWSPDLFVTCGVSGGILLAMFACLNPGDEVLITDPYFVSYAHMPKLAGGVPVPVSLYDDFQLHPERIAAAITPRTKMIIIASPSNPTGVVFRESDVRAVCELARKHDLLIIADEIYDLLHYDEPIPSPVRFAPERTLLLRGFGKSYSLTGFRLGFAAGPSEIIEEMSKLQQYTFVCAPQPGQWGALEALDTDISQHVNDYRRKRDLACEELRGCLEFVKPSGAFYLFPRVPKRYKNSTEFVAAAIKRKLLVIPGEVFSRQDTHFRLSFGVPEDRLRRGCAIIRELAT